MRVREVARAAQQCLLLVTRCRMARSDTLEQDWARLRNTGGAEYGIGVVEGHCGPYVTLGSL